jgi:hypothetical protein
MDNILKCLVPRRDFDFSKIDCISQASKLRKQVTKKGVISQGHSCVLGSERLHMPIRKSLIQFQLIIVINWEIPI